VPKSTISLKDRVIKLRISPGNPNLEKDEQLGIKNWTIIGKMLKAYHKI
jgi:DNA-binding CsgD family transcriptional regulator